MLRELLTNLIDNAIAYTLIGGRIIVSCGWVDGDGFAPPEGRRAFLSVEDSGIGIPAADRGRFFERFFRDPGTPVNGTGLGLGLAIVREIADQHEATIELTSGRDGRGTYVGIVFPARHRPS